MKCALPAGDMNLGTGKQQFRPGHGKGGKGQNGASGRRSARGHHEAGQGGVRKPAEEGFSGRASPQDPQKRPEQWPLYLLWWQLVTWTESHISSLYPCLKPSASMWVRLTALWSPSTKLNKALESPPCLNFPTLTPVKQTNKQTIISKSSLMTTACADEFNKRSFPHSHRSCQNRNRGVGRWCRWCRGWVCGPG